jgi:hypothetical protein
MRPLLGGKCTECIMDDFQRDMRCISRFGLCNRKGKTGGKGLHAFLIRGSLCLAVVSFDKLFHHLVRRDFLSELGNDSMRFGNMTLAMNSFADAIGCFGLALSAKDRFNGIQQIYIVETEYALILQDTEGEILDTDVKGEDLSFFRWNRYLWHHYTYLSSMVYTINYRLRLMA